MPGVLLAYDVGYKKLQANLIYLTDESMWYTDSQEKK
jgi:hypothetical protein